MNPYKKNSYVLKIIYLSFYISSIGSLLFIANIYFNKNFLVLTIVESVFSDLFYSITLGIIIANVLQSRIEKAFCIGMCAILSLLNGVNFLIGFISANDINYIYISRLLSFMCEITLSLFYLFSIVKLQKPLELKKDPIFWWVGGFFAADCLHIPLLFYFNKPLEQYGFLISLKTGISLIHILISLKAMSCRPQTASSISLS